MEIIPEDERRRLHVNTKFPTFAFGKPNEKPNPPGSAAVWTREIYGAPVVSILDVRAESEAAHRAAYAAARAREADASAGGFDMYADGGELAYISDNCGDGYAPGRFALHVFPVEQSDLPDFPISHIETWQYIPGESPLWSARIPLDGWDERHRRALASLSGEPAIRSDFDVYVEDDRLIYAKEGCAESDARGRFFLSVFPADQDDLPQTARDAGLEHEPRNFDFARGAIFDGKCAIIQDLPSYPISRIETGQWTDGEGVLWSAEIPLDAYYERYREALASLSGEQPAIRSDFDVYVEDDALTYVKEVCAESDTRGRFFLSLFPADSNDLPQSARDAGLEHEPRNFDFSERGAGAAFDGKCVIIRDLPDYPIAVIETGQFTDGEGVLWSAEIPLDAYWQQYRDALSPLSGEPAIRSDFDVYMRDDTLIYVKAHCSEWDARGRFFLSVFPADPRDLPQSAIDAGFEHEPLNFDFDQYGAIFDGKCAIVRDLPDYPIGVIETGQFLPGEGELWSGRITP